VQRCLLPCIACSERRLGLGTAHLPGAQAMQCVRADALVLQGPRAGSSYTYDHQISGLLHWRVANCHGPWRQNTAGSRQLGSCNSPTPTTPHTVASIQPQSGPNCAGYCAGAALQAAATHAVFSALLHPPSCSLTPHVRMHASMQLCPCTGLCLQPATCCASMLAARHASGLANRVLPQ
jgi:hypothetical protein